MSIFAKTEVNRERQPELDLLKAVCIVAMIFNHALVDCAVRACLVSLQTCAIPLFLHPFRVLFGGDSFTRGCALRAYPGLYSLHAFSVLKYKQSLGAECCLIDNASRKWTMVAPSGVRLDVFVG